MTKKSKVVLEDNPLKARLRKAFRNLTGASNHPNNIKKFCEALIDYQLYQAFKQHDQYNNQDKTLSDEKALSEVWDIVNHKDLDPSEDDSTYYQRSSMYKVPCNNY
jgi:hypothetical protein